MPVIQHTTPKCYLSTSHGQWRVINQGMPVCKDMPSREEALAAAKLLSVTPTELWDGDAGVFKPLTQPDAGACLAKAAGQALNAAYPWGYQSADSEP